MAQAHRHDRPDPSPAAAAEPAQPVAAADTVYGTLAGHPLHGYLAHPQAHAASGLPAIVVIHEWWGLNDNIRAMTRRLAGEGYTALAVDLYGGTSATTPDKAKELMAGVLARSDEATANLRQAVDFLKQQGATRIGVIGWCFGGGWSLEAALAMPDDISAAVVYYGHLETDRARLARLKAPVLGLFGADDQSIPAAGVLAFQAAAKELGKNVEVKIYDGAGHAFANPSGTHYRPEAARDAWRRTVEFFAKYMKKT
jgi:carboxymethylenebutenolidase